MSLDHEAKGPVNYTVVGEATITDGVVSNFSENNYIQLNNSQISNVYSFESCIKIKFSSENLRGWFYHFGGFALSKYDRGNLEFLYRNEGDSWQAIRVAGAQTNIANTWIWIKAGCQNGTAYLSYSFDGKSYTTAGTSQYNLSTARIYANSPLGKSDSSRDLGNGSIDLNETYFIVNGQPWFGNCPIEVKRHQIMGPVGYNVVGSPTIKDGIATDFTTTSYLRTNLQFDFSQTDYEFVIRATPHAVSTRNAAIVGTQPVGLRIYFMQDKIECIPATGGATPLAVRGTFDVSSFYYVRLIRKGNVYTLDYSLDGINYASAVSVTNQQHLSSSLFIQFGYYGSDGWDPLDGKIDFNHTYIKANDELWFYQPQETKYIIRDGKLVWADPRLALSGPVNYGIVGSPTIVDGIASGFSGSNYLQLTDFSIKPSDSLELCLEINTGSLSSPSTIFGTNQYNEPNNTGVCSLLIQEQTNGKLYLFVPASYNQFVSSSYTLSSNTDYILKINREANSKLYTLNTYTKSGTLVGTTSITAEQDLEFTYIKFGRSGYTTVYPFIGSIDLNNTYIKVNGDLWFYGKNYATSNIAPVPAGYTYGTTTTSAIGYVDMRTQVFTAAPSGATIGRDE